ncbi:MAG: hypothetical protein LBC73_09485 [Oscillospiraceae bacterium]|jgi:hypothetical protein|nr:hypothetical protein [Oscillospiraceae bacterium]
MRKHQQKQILEVIETLYEAQASELYADCQEGALGVGEYIEEIVGEGTTTVSLLEEYCELIYKASNSETTQKELKKQLEKVEVSVKNELKPNRIEMVFLSYKAAMSDSLESIYIAAKEDANCDAYWIPIPYYEKNPDGSFGEKHYEGAEFYKENIVCTDYREYDIKARHPDVIISFSPYDNLGKMTSVDPNYYFENLRSQTDLLVYVPYYVTTVDAAKPPFTQCPGVLYSHKVVVQSEEIRECFIRDYNELIKIGYSEEIYGKAEDKFVALGSPKFDAVINAKREDYKLPTEWHNLMQNPDGSTKKAIFYNTSITASLNNPEQYLKKLKYVLNTFKQHNEVLLWWRPHPLARTAYSGIYPELEKEYDDIVAEYISTGWGIYDDTPDLHRAIVWSDAYYGDSSSVVMLYEVTGKPFVVDKQLNDNLLVQQMYDTDYGLFFTSLTVNSLFKLNKSTFEVEHIARFPGNELDSWRLYGNAAENNGKLYFPPFNSSLNNIIIFDMNNNTYESITIDDRFMNNVKKAKFYFSISVGMNVYFIGYSLSVILKFNVVTNELISISTAHDALVKREYCFLSGLIKDNHMYLTTINTNALIMLDLENFSTSVHHIGNGGFRAICYSNKNFWLTPFNAGPIIRWNPNDLTTIEYNDYPEGFVAGDIPFVNSFMYNEYLWLLPFNANMEIKLDTTTGEITKALEFQNEYTLPNEQNKVKYVSVNLVNKTFFLSDYRTGDFIEYRPDDIIKIHKLSYTVIKNVLDMVFSDEHIFEKTIYEKSGVKILETIRNCGS